MKLYLWASLVFAVLTNFYSLEAFCQETTLKDRLKQRWIENQKKKPAPEVSSIQGEIDKTGTYTFSIESNSLKRYYMLYVPPQYNKELPQPLMIAMHGGGGSMLAQSRDEIYGLISKSKKEGFVVVFPMATAPLLRVLLRVGIQVNAAARPRKRRVMTWDLSRICSRI